MRALVVILALVAVGGAVRVGIAAQVERSFVFYRICNIEPGRDAAAVALAEEIVNLASWKYPSARMAASKGRWMTAFQEIARPVNQILFSEQHPSLLGHQDFADVLLVDDDFQALQRKISGVIDVSSCVETQAHASP